MSFFFPSVHQVSCYCWMMSNMTDTCRSVSSQNVSGILSLLDEECLRPGNTSDLTFLAKLNDRCAGHPHYESRNCRKNQSDKTLPHDAFRLCHYAGNVSFSW